MGPGPWYMRWGAGVGRVVLDWVAFYKQKWGWVNDQNGNPLPQAGPWPGVVYVNVVGCSQFSGGTAIWPQDGDDAVPPGAPGRGGAGGVVASSVTSISSFSQV